MEISSLLTLDKEVQVPVAEDIYSQAAAGLTGKTHVGEKQPDWRNLGKAVELGASFSGWGSKGYTKD